MSPEEKIDAAQKLIAEAMAELTAKKRNWPEKIEPGMLFRWVKGSVYIFARGGCLVNVATGETFEGDQGFRGKQDQFTYLGHARDLIKIANVAHEPTGAELVGRRCVYTDDDGRTRGAGRVCEVYEPGRGYSWGTRTTWYKHARLAR